MSLPGRCTGASSQTSLSGSRAERFARAFRAVSSAGWPARRKAHISCGRSGTATARSTISPLSTRPIRVRPACVKVASFTAFLLVGKQYAWHERQFRQFLKKNPLVVHGGVDRLLAEKRSYLRIPSSFPTPLRLLLADSTIPCPATCVQL